MAVGLCWLPLRHPLHAPAPALYWGMMPLTPVSTASSWTQDALITPLPPHWHPNTMVQTGGKTPRSQVPSGPAAIDTTTATAPNAVTTPPPPARGLGGHPWSYNPLFLLESSEQHVCPSPGSPTPRWSTVPRAIVVTTTDKLPPPKRTHVGAATILWTRVNCFPPVEDGASHSPHAVPTLPTRCGITRSVSRNAAKLLWTRMLTQMPMRGQPSDHSPT